MLVILETEIQNRLKATDKCSQTTQQQTSKPKKFGNIRLITANNTLWPLNNKIGP